MSPRFGLAGTIGLLTLTSCNPTFTLFGPPAGGHLPSCSSYAGSVSGLEIQPESLTIAVGASAMLAVRITATSPPATCVLSWSSSNPGVASVPPNGAPAVFVEGISPGIATISVSGYGETAYAKVTVQTP